MQSAATVLDVLRKRGEKGLPLERLYRQLFNPQLFLLAYGRIYANQGAMTPGVTPETVDGMSLAKIDAIIDALRHERYWWRPVKRVYIPKANGKLRPLGLPTWSDKLVAEVVRLLLEAYYEPQFSDRSHGFRPGRGCHTALSEVVDVWKGTHWFIEGDISDCFGSLDHQVMLSILAERIHDGRFLRLLGHMLKAGYLEDWRFNATLSGTPQGGVASPILSNIYLDRLDRFVEQQLLPANNHGRRRRRNPAYQTVEYQIAKAKRHGDRRAVRLLTQRRGQAALHALPAQGEPGTTRLAVARRRLHHRREVPGRVRRAGPVLPARPGRVPPGRPPLDHGDLAAQDPGRKAPLHGHQDGSTLQGDDPDIGWAARVPPGHRRTRRGQEAPDRPLRRDPAQEAAHGRPHRSTAGHGQHPAQRAAPSAPGRTLRGLPSPGEP